MLLSDKEDYDADDADKEDERRMMQTRMRTLMKNIIASCVFCPGPM
jgi:hypothetical protein